MSSPEQVQRVFTTRQLSRQRIYAHLALARISNSPTVVSDTLAGAALVGGVGSSLRWGDVTWLALALVLFYTAGMYLNDICDYHTDCVQRADRPLPSGLVGRGEAAVVMAVLFLGGLVLLGRQGWRPVVAGVVLVALIVAYDRWHKANPLSPVVMGLCRLMVYVTAYVAFTSHLTGDLFLAGGLLTLYIVSLTFIAKHEAAHISGASRWDAWPAALPFLPVLYFALRAPSALLLGVAVLYVAWAVYSLSWIYRARGRAIGRGVAFLIAGVSLFDALVLASVGAGLAVAVALVAFAATIVFQRYVSGT